MAPNTAITVHPKMAPGNSNNTLYIPRVSSMVPDIQIPAPQNAVNALATWAGSDKFLKIDNAIRGFYEKVCWNLDWFTINENMTWNHIAAYYVSGAASHARQQLHPGYHGNITFFHFELFFHILHNSEKNFKICVQCYIDIIYFLAKLTFCQIIQWKYIYIIVQIWNSMVKI